MKKNILVISIAAVICLGLIIYSIYVADFNPFTQSDEVAIEYRDSLIVNLPMEKVRTLNPVISKDADTYQLSKLIFESLFYFDEKLSLVNGLASSYSYSGDKKTVTIQIRTDAYFSNGSNLTGADVKYSIDNYIAAGSNTIYSSYVSNIRSVSVDKNDKYTVKINFKNTDDVSLENLVFPIVLEKNFGKSSAARLASVSFVPIGSGPYAVEKYNDISELKLSANTHYSGEKPQNTLSFTVLPEKKSALPLLEVGNISMSVIEELSRDTLISDKNIEVVNFPSNELEVLGFNFSRPTMQNKKVRQAIAYSIDTEEINEGSFYKNGIICDTIYYPEYLGTENTGDNYKFNLEKSAKLLQSAGYMDRDENGYIEDKNGDELSIEILVNSVEPSRVVAAEDIKVTLDKLSISNKIIYAESKELFSAKLNGKEYDIFLGGLKINETYDLRNLLHSQYSNMIGYVNPKLDKLLDELKSGIDNEKKKQTLEEIKKILIDELPYYCIAYKTYGALLSDSLRNNQNSYRFNSYYNGCTNWYCQYPVIEEKKIVASDGDEFQ